MLNSDELTWYQNALKTSHLTCVMLQCNSCICLLGHLLSESHRLHPQSHVFVLSFDVVPFYDCVIYPNSLLTDNEQTIDFFMPFFFIELPYQIMRYMLYDALCK